MRCGIFICFWSHKLNRKLSILTLLLFYSLYITTPARMAHCSDCDWCCFPGTWWCASSCHICYLQMEEWVMSFKLNNRIILQYGESEIGRVWLPGSPPSILNSLVFGVIIIPISIKCANKQIGSFVWYHSAVHPPPPFILAKFATRNFRGRCIQEVNYSDNSFINDPLTNVVTLLQTCVLL